MVTKNIYVGNQRVASKVEIDPEVTSPPPPNIFYYGTDHLGSSTYLTDNTGKIVEHIEYLPWGESWDEESDIPVDGYREINTPFRFTGKELDRTGYYYYGARYYDPEVSLWLSPDPVLGKYLDSVEKGQGNSADFALYTYCRQNPMVLVDPDGEITLSISGFKTYSAGRSTTKEAGFVLGFSFKSGWQFGLIETEIKSGIETDYGAFFGLKAEITSASNIDNLSGEGYEVGAVGGVIGPTIGTSVGIGGDTENDTSYASWSISGGSSASLLPGSATAAKTETKVQELKPSLEGIKDFFKYNFSEE